MKSSGMIFIGKETVSMKEDYGRKKEDIKIGVKSSYKSRENWKNSELQTAYPE